MLLTRLIITSFSSLLFCNTVWSIDKEALTAAISGPDREIVDYARDETRKPVEVLDFLGIEPGMNVLDVYAAGGYYTFILSKAVGPTGKIYAQNTPRGLRFVEDRQDISQGDALQEKITRGNLVNVFQLVQRVDSLTIEPESLDAILVVQTLHDYYNPSTGRALLVLRQLKALLKPGGVIGVIDHAGTAGRDNRRFHRMEKAQAIEIAETAGLAVIGDSDLLHNPYDRHERSIFDPMLARNTDRFFLKLQKL